LGTNQIWAKVIGVILLLVGVIGFFMGDMVLGIFGVNALHNIVHLVTGAVYAWAGFAARAPAQDVNKWLGVIYVLVGIVGFFGVLGFLNVNAADNWLHLVIGAVSAWLGWKGD
jgi:uncharacterized membrane protein YuzA (DUF378 family)